MMRFDDAMVTDRGAGRGDRAAERRRRTPHACYTFSRVVCVKTKESIRESFSYMSCQCRVSETEPRETLPGSPTRTPGPPMVHGDLWREQHRSGTAGVRGRYAIIYTPH